MARANDESIIFTTSLRAGGWKRPQDRANKTQGRVSEGRAGCGSLWARSDRVTRRARSLLIGRIKVGGRLEFTPGGRLRFSRRRGAGWTAMPACGKRTLASTCVMLDVIKRNHVRILGEGEETWIFAHGFGCDQTMWRRMAPLFEGRRVVLFDYVGSGGSDYSAYRPDRYATLEGYAADLLEVVEAAGGRPVTLVAHSVSAMIGVLAAVRRPEWFRRLVLIGPSPCYLNEGDGYSGGFERADIEGLLEMLERNPLGWAGFLAPLVMKNPARPGLTEELHASFCAMDPEIARRFAGATFLADNRRDLAAVRTPTLILQCSEDAIAPERVGRFVHEHIGGSVLRVLRATGHCPHMSHPEETMAVINNWVEAGA